MLRALSDFRALLILRLWWRAVCYPQALQRLQEAQTGIYCGPLRLLAWEVYEKLNGNGVVSRKDVADAAALVDYGR